jgi:hypothetical protein
MPLRAARGTKALLDTRAAANALRDGDIYYLTDLKVYAFGTGVNTYLVGQTSYPLRSGLDLSIANNQSTLVPTAQVAANLRAFPWLLRRPVTIIAMRSEVTTLIATSTYRLGIYADNGSAYPGALVTNSDVGAIDSSTAGVKVSTFASLITLSPGLYWSAINCSAAPTLRSIPVGAIENILGCAPTGGNTAPFTGWSIAQTYAALPVIFPAGAGLLTSNAPMVLFKVQ